MFRKIELVKALIWSWLSVTVHASVETDVTVTEYLLHTPENPDVADILPHDASSLGNFNVSRGDTYITSTLGEGEGGTQKEDEVRKVAQIM